VQRRFSTKRRQSAAISTAPSRDFHICGRQPGSGIGHHSAVAALARKLVVSIW